jgi:flagellar hook assembly protein FlgD
MPDRGMSIGSNHPVGGSSVLQFGSAQSRFVSIEVYDRHAKRVRTLASRAFPAGLFDVQWDLQTDSGTPAPSGWYLVVLQKSPLPAATALAANRPDIVVPPPVTNDSLSWGRGHILIP